MSKAVTLTIDGKQVSVPAGTLVVNAAKQAGVTIPVFCYHPKMEPVGMCRMCLVEVGRPAVDRATGQAVLEADGSPKIQFGPKLETACTLPVSEGMVVRGLTPEVKRARKDILEFLLTSHPLDCPVCDKGGECPLQNLTMDFGAATSRFIFDEKMHLQKHLPLGELIFLDRERCIQCGRCVRFQSEIAADPVIGFAQRGRSLQIVTSSEPGFDSYFSGNTTDICPVGALTTADFRFGARPWEMKAAASLCAQCPVGCNLTFNTRREHKTGGEIVIKRAMPRQNEQVNEIWICDKGRFGYHYTDSPERLKTPLVRKGGELQPASWEEALSLASGAMGQAKKDLLTLASGRLANEDLFTLRRLSEKLGGQAALYTSLAGGDLVAQVGVEQGTNLSALGPETAILVIASDLKEEAPIYWLRLKQAAQRGVKLIVANPRPTKLDFFAGHQIRYTYGSEAVVVLAMLNALSAKRLGLGKILDAPTLRQVEEAAKAFAGAENGLVVFGSEGLGLEGSQALARACADLLIATGHTGKPNNGLLGVWQRANDQGAWELGFRPLGDLPAALSAAPVWYIVAADPLGDDPQLKAQVVSRRGEANGGSPNPFIVVQELFLTETARLADVVLPAQAYVEREGSFTNGERRVQRFYPVIPARSGARPDFAITAEIASCLGFGLEAGSPQKVMEEIASAVPAFTGLTYERLAQVEPQWPIIARADLYYGGTTYENSQGLGVQLQSAAERGEPVDLGWPAPANLAAGNAVQEPGLLAVPVSRMYDRGRTLLPSQILEARIPEPYVALNPADALSLGVTDGSMVQLSLGGTDYPLRARLDPEVPAGVTLVPRGLGVPVSEPARVEARSLELAVA